MVDNAIARASDTETGHIEWPGQADRGLDMRALSRALWRRRRAILGPTLLVAVLTAIGVNMLTPKFKSEARILYDGRENVFLRPEAEKANTERTAADQETLISQVQLVLSRELAFKVIKGLGLNENPEFDPLRKGLSPLTQVLIFTGLVRDPMRMSAEERVLEAYYQRLTAFPVDRSRVIAIEFVSADPDLAARAANAVAEGYLDLERAAKQEQTRAAGQWLAGEIEGLRRRVAEAEAKVEAFRAKTNLFVGTNNTMLTNQQLGEFNSQLGMARAQKAEAEARARLIREMLRRREPIEATEIVNSELIRRLSEQRVTLRAQLAEQSSSLLEAHPRIKELKAQIADLDRQIREEADRLARAFETDAKVAEARVESLNASLDLLKRQAATTNEQDVQLRALEREAKAQRELLESYLVKYREATARESIGTAPPNARIISRALASNTPYFPKKLPIVLVATLATVTLSAGLVTAGELLRVPAQEGSAVARARASFDGGAIVFKPSAAMAAMDDFVRQLRGAREPDRRLAVFGSSRFADTMGAAMAIARMLARDARVVVIDLAATSDIAAISSDPRAPGIADVLRGTASFGDIITRDKVSRVHLIGAGHTRVMDPAMIGSLRVTTMVEALARTYDYVVVNGGVVSDAAVAQIARLAPRAVLLIENANAPIAKAASERLLAAGYREPHVLAWDVPELPSQAA